MKKIVLLMLTCTVLVSLQSFGLAIPNDTKTECVLKEKHLAVVDTMTVCDQEENVKIAFDHLLVCDTTEGILFVALLPAIGKLSPYEDGDGDKIPIRSSDPNGNYFNQIHRYIDIPIEVGWKS